MAARRSALILLTVMFLVIPVVQGQANTAPDAAGVSRLTDAGGVFAWFMEFARGLFTTQPPAVSAGDEENGVFSKNPYVYIAAFWAEIVNAPKGSGFIERIMAFLDAVRVGRSRRS